MQNCKIEQQTSDQQATSTGSIQMMPTVLGTANGQQILLQSLSQQLNANGQQQIQMVPIQTLGQGSGTIIVQPQATPQPQIVQLPDGQTFIYQPVAMPEAQQAQPQIVNINGNYYQINTQPQHHQTHSAQTIQTHQQASSQNAQNQPQQTQVVMMTAPTTSADIQQQQQQQNVTNVNNFNANQQATSATPPPQMGSASGSTTPTPPAESEEEPLYVNASKLFFFSIVKR